MCSKNKFGSKVEESPHFIRGIGNHYAIKRLEEVLPIIRKPP
jgi:hypothetical protein